MYSSQIVFSKGNAVTNEGAQLRRIRKVHERIYIHIVFVSIVTLYGANF